MVQRADGVPVAGVMKIPQGMDFPPHWGMYVGVPKIEDAVAQVERLGGSALSPLIDVPGVGRMRTMRDPQGAAFSLYQPASPPQLPEGEAQVGDISWHELYTTDAEAAMAFYGRCSDGGRRKPWTWGRWGSTTCSGGRSRSRHDEHAADHGAGATTLGLLFPRARRARRRRACEGRGGQVLNGPMEVPAGTGP